LAPISGVEGAIDISQCLQEAGVLHLAVVCNHRNVPRSRPLAIDSGDCLTGDVSSSFSEGNYTLFLARRTSLKSGLGYPAKRTKRRERKMMLWQTTTVPHKKWGFASQNEVSEDTSEAVSDTSAGTEFPEFWPEGGPRSARIFENFRILAPRRPPLRMTPNINNNWGHPGGGGGVPDFRKFPKFC